MSKNTLIRMALPALTLTVALLLFGFTNLDLNIQDRLFDFGTQQWLVSRWAPGPRLVFYDLPKVLLIALGVVLLAVLLWPEQRRPAWLRLPWERRRLWLLLLSMAIVPLTIGAWKSRSNLHCPWALERYGGTHPYHHLFAPPPDEAKKPCGRCFPAGHASGGFALLALGHVLRRRWLGWTLGLATGWAMGGYQMLKGAHFLSHTVVTMLVAWLLVELLAAILLRRPDTTPSPAADHGHLTNN